MSTDTTSTTKTTSPTPGATVTPAPLVPGSHATPATGWMVGTAGSGKSAPHHSALRGGELTSVRVLKAEAKYMQAYIEQFEVMARTIRGWSVALPDRLSAAGWGTAGLGSAAAGIAENGGRSGSLSEQINVLLREVARAESLGEHVSAAKAKGDTTAFVPQ